MSNYKVYEYGKKPSDAVMIEADSFASAARNWAIKIDSEGGEIAKENQWPHVTITDELGDVQKWMIVGWPDGTYEVEQC